MTRLPCPYCSCCSRYGCEIDGDPSDCDGRDVDGLPCPCAARGGEPL